MRRIGTTVVEVVNDHDSGKIYLVITVTTDSPLILIPRRIPFTPKKARELAADLVRSADDAEGNLSLGLTN